MVKRIAYEVLGEKKGSTSIWRIESFFYISFRFYLLLDLRLIHDTGSILVFIVSEKKFFIYINFSFHYKFYNLLTVFM